MDAPKRIGLVSNGLGGFRLWSKYEVGMGGQDAPDAEYILAAEHDRIVADMLVEIDRLQHDRDNWRGRAEFAEAQFEALAELAPPPQKGLLLRRLKELAAKRRG